MPYADSDQAEYDREMADIDSPGPCTSFVVQDPDDKVWAGRNLDWNFPGIIYYLYSVLDACWMLPVLCCVVLCCFFLSTCCG
jgi:hypothetical protein